MMARRWATFQAVGCLVQSYFPYRLVKRQYYHFVHLQLHPQQANGISQNEKFAKPSILRLLHNALPVEIK